MGSTFWGLELARRALSAQQSALYTTGHNIANANTEGYTRQRVNMEATPALPYPSAVNDTSPGQIGTGVTVESVQRIREDYLDLQFRTENHYQGEWETKVDALKKIEAFFNETSDTGLRASIDSFWKALQDLSNNPEDPSARETLRNAGVDVGDTLNYLSRSMAKLQEDLDSNIQIRADEATTLLKQIEGLNQKIGAIVPHGYSPNDLYDQRNLLVDKLSKLMDIDVTKVSQNGKDTGLIDISIRNKTSDGKPELIDVIKGGKLVGTVTTVRKPIDEKQAKPTDPHYNELQIAGKTANQPGGVLGALVEARGLPVEVTNFGVLPQVITSDPMNAVSVYQNTGVKPDSVLEQGEKINLSFNIPLKNSPIQIDAIQKAVDERFGSGNVKVTTDDYQTFTLTVNQGKTINLSGGKNIEIPPGTVQNTDGTLNNKAISFNIPDVQNPSMQKVEVVSGTKNDGALKVGDKIVLTFDRAMAGNTESNLQEMADQIFGKDALGNSNVQVKQLNHGTYELQVKKDIQISDWKDIKLTPAAGKELQDTFGNKAPELSFKIHDSISFNIDSMNAVKVNTDTTSGSSYLKKGDTIELQFNMPLLNEPDQLKAVQSMVDAKFGVGNLTVSTTDNKTFLLTVNADNKVNLRGGITLSFEKGMIKSADGVPNGDKLNFSIPDPQNPILKGVSFGTNQTGNDGILSKDDTFILTFDRDMKDPDDVMAKLQAEFDKQFGPSVVQVSRKDGTSFSEFEVKVVDPNGLSLVGGKEFNLPAGLAQSPAPTLTDAPLTADSINKWKGTETITANGTFTGAADEEVRLTKTAAGWTINGVLKDPVEYNGVTFDTSKVNADAQVGDSWTITLNATKSNAATSVTLRDAIIKPAFDSAEYSSKTIVMKGIVPSYQGRLNAFAVKMTEEINRVHTKTGSGADMAYDLDMIKDIKETGSTSRRPVNFFVSRKDPTRPPQDASDIQVNPEIMASINKIAAATKYTATTTEAGTSYRGDGTNARDMAALKFLDLVFPDLSLNNYGKPNESTTMDAFARYTVSKIGGETQSAQKFKSNSDVIMEHIQYQRDAVSGVSLDEEMSNMIKFQHAYNAAARTVTAMDEMLDKVINSMGLVGR